ncbi:MAG: DUF3047 domain-containing protein [Candidatus Omnitrophota bacterium]
MMRKIALVLLIILLAGAITVVVYYGSGFRRLMGEAGVHAGPEGRATAIEELVRFFPFSRENCLKEWEEKILKKRVTYTIEQDTPQLSFVKARSVDSASAMFYKIDLNIRKDPVISWKWKVREFPRKSLPESIDGKREEDFAARVYVIFPASFFTNSKAIEYIWAEELPAGTQGTSGYTNNLKVMVLRSGPDDSEWRTEERDIRQDYIALYGAEPGLNVGAISFMTDADSTGTSASALYDDIKIGYKRRSE